MVVCAGPLGHGGTHTADCAFLQRLGFVSLSWALVSGNAAGRQLQTRTRLLVEASGCVRAPLLVVSGRRHDDHARRRSAQARLARAKVGRQPACWDGRVQPSCTQHSLSARACIRTALRRTAMRAKLEPDTHHACSCDPTSDCLSAPNQSQQPRASLAPNRWRPYRVECTGSLPTSEVKRRRAQSVLGWGTAREDLRVLPALRVEHGRVSEKWRTITSQPAAKAGAPRVPGRWPHTRNHNPTLDERTAREDLMVLPAFCTACSR